MYICIYICVYIYDVQSRSTFVASRSIPADSRARTRVHPSASVCNLAARSLNHAGGQQL